MPTKKKTTTKTIGDSETMSMADIRRAQRMHKDLQLKLNCAKEDAKAIAGGNTLRLELQEVKDELKQMMNHIPHCA